MIGTAVACPDKFRGSLTAAAAAAAMAHGLRTAGAEVVIELPLADGGEGTLDVILATRGGARRTARVTGPLGDEVEAEWAMLGDGTADRGDGAGPAGTPSSTRPGGIRSRRAPAGPAS